MVEIVWASEAQKWMQDIFDYIAQDNPLAAMKVVTGNVQDSMLLTQHSKLNPQHCPSL
jgi:toxin ParE1/3/4